MGISPLLPMFSRAILFALYWQHLLHVVYAEPSEIPPAPNASVFVYETNSLNRRLLSDFVNSEVQVDKGRKFELECTGDSPVQWAYRGIGTPEFSSNVEVSLLRAQEVHKATLLISNANDKHTGMYVCSYAEFPQISSSFHVFVPGSEIFVSDKGRVIDYSLKNTFVTIPCPVSEKRAKVTLRKVFFDSSLRNVPSPLATFDPKIGFKLNVKDVRDVEGVYVCTGYHEGSLRLREYILRNEERNQTVTAVTFPEEDINPCISYSCPLRSVCRVNLNTNQPFCACRRGAGSGSNCIRICKTSYECPRSEKCQFSIDKQLKMCLHVCDDHKCAENGECYVNEQRGSPHCRCRRGFRGNGDVECERIPLKAEDDAGTSYCSIAKCGPNSQCESIDGKTQCACATGTVGVWPLCDKACTQDTDCTRISEKCSEKGTCVPVCSENMCAPKAECKALHRKPMCICPPGYTGRATEACYPSHYFFRGRMGLAAEDLEDIDGETTTGNFESS